MLVTALEQHAISSYCMFRLVAVWETGQIIRNEIVGLEWEVDNLHHYIKLWADWTPGTLEGSTHPPVGPAMRCFGFCGQ